MFAYLARATLLLPLALPLRAQGVLDVLDGETLYDGGSLFSLGFEYERGDVLRNGSQRVADPDASHEFTTKSTVAFQHGLRNDLQFGVALPYVTHDHEGITTDFSTAGLGDVALLGKWRFYRWDAPGKALNIALLGELSLPTGEDDATIGGTRIEPELQVGSGGVDPSLGLGVTHEPGRWRFNAAALYRWRTDTDGDDTRLGDDLTAELAVGNRFWLEPYPGPFMRADVFTRWYDEDASEQAGATLPNTGGERWTAGVNWAFRPRPALDFQINFETTIDQDVGGTQLGEDWSVDFTFGYRF